MASKIQERLVLGRGAENSLMGWYLNMEVEGTSIKWWLGLAVAVQEIRSGSRLEYPGEAGAGGNLGDSE